MKWEIKKSPRGTVRKSQLSLILLKKTVFARILPPSPRPIQFLIQETETAKTRKIILTFPLWWSMLFLSRIRSIVCPRQSPLALKLLLRKRVILFLSLSPLLRPQGKGTSPLLLGGGSSFLFPSLAEISAL